VQSLHLNQLACTGEALASETAAAIKAAYHAAWTVSATATVVTTAAAAAIASTDDTGVVSETTDTAPQRQQQQQQQLDWQSLLVTMSAVGESPLPSGFSEGLHRAAIAVGATVGTTGGVTDIVKLSSDLQLLVLGATTAGTGSSVSALHAQAVQCKLHTLLPSAVTLDVGAL
jgi:hypothetical protein